MGACMSREDEQLALQVLELQDEVQGWKATATDLNAQNIAMQELRRSGSAEKGQLRQEAEELSKRVDLLQDQYAHSVANRFRGSVKQVGLRREVSILDKENTRMEHGTSLAVQTIRPLQIKIEDGDILGLQDTINELTPRLEKNDSEFGELAGIVRALYRDAVVKSDTWREVLATIKAVLETSKDRKFVRHDMQRLLAAVKEASITGLSLCKSDQELTDRIKQMLRDFYLNEGICDNKIQREIIRRACESTHFRDFDFADLSQCVHLVDMDETPSNEFYLSRAATVLNNHEVWEFKHILTSLDTICFFLRFIDQEDLAMTYKLYKSIQLEPWAMKCIRDAERQYGPGNELVHTQGLNLQNEDHVVTILKQIQDDASGGKIMQGLRSIFFSWAELMKRKFGMLVLPHHTQVVCMLMFLQHIESHRTPNEVGALIAEVGTGEGKSAVIASLALYCVKYLGKQVHVIVDDENLVERDFQTFQDLFSSFQNKQGKSVDASLCVSASRKRGRFANDKFATVRIDEKADIVYCEAKHVQSFYTQLAKSGGADIDAAYENRVLVLDEVDALIISEAPNVPFVYENHELSDFATKAAEAMLRNAPLDQLEKSSANASEKKVLRQLQKAALTACKWSPQIDFVFDAESNKYVRVREGQAQEEAWSLALEYKNFAEHLSQRITYNERLFLMNRPRVFRKYSRIVGLSGSVGSDTERRFLNTIYHAKFFKVPKFLETCRGFVSNLAQPLGVVVERDQDTQLRVTCDKAFTCREQAPVLVIAKDRNAAARLAQELHCIASAKGLDEKDIVCLLSRDLFENQPQQFKENLFRCTQPIGRGSVKTFRIAVTDPRGGRGIDYRVSDPDADRAGGLTLIVNYIPKCSRDWTQYLGRTARQDRQGQWMAVLNAEDYSTECNATGQVLHPGTAVQTILAWGNGETELRLQAMHGQYHRGLRVNELSEEVAKFRLLDKNPSGREAMVQLCNQYEGLSLQQIDMLAGKIPGLRPPHVPSEAAEVGPGVTTQVEVSSRSIAFLIDRSSSMQSRDAAGATRFDVCRECIMNIFEKHVQDNDQIALYTFETQVQEAFPLTMKGQKQSELATMIRTLPAPHGLTKLYDGVFECLQRLQTAGSEAKYLVTLTDGDDNQSVQQPNGERVSALLRGAAEDVNLIFITCGRDIKPRTLELVKYWSQLAHRSGRIGVHLAANDPAHLREAFAKAAELIDEPQGETEV